MTTDNRGENKIAALEAELARVRAERELMDARIRAGNLDVAPQGTRRADVLAWGAFFVAAALVASLVVTIAQQQPVVREHTRVETVIVPETPAPAVADAAPAVSGPVEVERPSTPRTRPTRPTNPGMTELLDDDRCGSDPTCGI